MEVAKAKARTTARYKLDFFIVAIIIIFVECPNIHSSWSLKLDVSLPCRGVRTFCQQEILLIEAYEYNESF